jgi:hypothetical protein
METVCSSEIFLSVSKSTQCHNPEDQHQHLCCEHVLEMDVTLTIKFSENVTASKDTVPCKELCFFMVRRTSKYHQVQSMSIMHITSKACMFFLQASYDLYLF